MATAIPTPYRIFFTTVDPLFAITGTITSLFFPSAILGPSAPEPPTPESTFLLQSLAGFYTACLVLQVFLLRARPGDLGVWRILQASLLVTDIAIVAAFVKFHGGRHGTAVPLSWRLEEAGNFVVTAGIGVVRVLFLLGVGMPSSGKAKGR